MKKTLIFLCQVGLISAASASGLGTCLYSEKEIQQARQNIEQMPAARAVQERLLSDVKPWLALDDTRISSVAASAKSSDLLSLAQAYLLTADPIYAHKAAILLDRFAELYLKDNESRVDSHLPGKERDANFGSLSEPGQIRDLIEAFSHILPALASIESALPDGRSGKQLETLVRTDLLTKISADLLDGSMQSPCGEHLRTALTLALLIQDPHQRQALIDLARRGLQEILENRISSDGIACEWSLQHSGLGAESLIACQTLLAKLGQPAFENPKLLDLVRFPQRLLLIDRFHPAIGDFGSLNASRVQLPLWTLRAAFDAFADPQLAAELLARRAAHEGAFVDFNDLFLIPLDGSRLQSLAAQSQTAPRSAVLDGYGIGILRDQHQSARLAATLYYGRAGDEHGHHDRLNIELFGCGKKLMPDFGCPSPDRQSPASAAWERNTLSHNTVMVDQRRQTNRFGGRLEAFAVTPTVQWISASAPAVYPDTVTHYKRRLALIEPPDGHPFFVDLFSVAGGQTHDYSLHGFAGKAKSNKILWDKQRGGSLAGIEVPYGTLTDDPAFRGKNPPPIDDYRGGGTAFLTDVRRGYPEGDWSFRWSAGDTTLSAFVPYSDEMQPYWCKGRPPDRPGNPAEIDFLIIRRQTAALSSTSLFATVLQSALKEPDITGVSELPYAGNRPPFSIALEIQRRNRGKIVVLANDDLSSWVRTRDHAFRGALAVLFYDQQGQVEAVDFINPMNFIADYTALEASGAFGGRIAECDYSRRVLTVIPNDSLLRGKTAGTTAIAGNDFNQSAVQIETGEWQNGKLQLRLSPNSLSCGRLFLPPDTTRQGYTTSRLCPEFYDNRGNRLRGIRLTDDKMEREWSIDWIDGYGKLYFQPPDQPLPRFSEGPLRMFHVGAGDRLQIDSWVRLQRQTDGRWQALSSLNRMRGVFGGQPIQVD